MNYGLAAGLVILIWGGIAIWKHMHECPEEAAFLSRFGAVGVGAGLALTLYCGYEVAETVMLTSVSAPLVATYQRCNDLESKEVNDIMRMGSTFQNESSLEADDAALRECNKVLGAYATAGMAVLTHGEAK